MNRFSDIYAPIIGRILMGGFFLWDGIEMSLNFDSTSQLLVTTGLPSPLVFAALIVAIEVLGGIALIVGFKSSAIAATLAIFTLAMTLLSLQIENETGVSSLLQHMAIVGGLLYIIAFGSGSWDPDFRYKRL